MSATADFVTDFLALGTIGMQIAAALLLVAIVFPRPFRPLFEAARPFILPLALILTFVGSALTLVYSEIFGMIPCFLCWVQRAFMYPMPFILGYGIWKGSEHIWKWVLALAIPGAIVASYQHYLQMGGASLVACPAVPGAEDCGQRLIFEFGFVTFPLMAFTVFVLVALLMIAHAVLRPASSVEGIKKR